MTLEHDVQWYPGHMPKALRRIREYLRAIDVVIEVVDARVAHSGRNPVLDDIAGTKAHVVALSRNDLAEPAATKAWVADFERRGAVAIAVDGRSRQSVNRIADAIARAPQRKRISGTSRAMIVGIPNSGKSTIVNTLLRRAAAKIEARAGVTRQVQWFRLSPVLELMDTPGVLPPKISSRTAQWKLALCDGVPATRYDAQEVIEAFHRWATDKRRSGVPDLREFATSRGFVRRGAEVDEHNAAVAYVRAFNDGVFGRFSLEGPHDAETA